MFINQTPRKLLLPRKLLPNGFDNSKVVYQGYSYGSSGDVFDNYFNDDYFENGYNQIPLVSIGGMYLSTKTPQADYGQYISWTRFEAI